MMGVTEDRQRQRQRDERRLDEIILRQIDIGVILDEDVSADHFVKLISEYDNLCIEREKLERNLQKKYI